MPSLGHQLAATMRKTARSDVDRMWTKGDAEVIAFPEPNDENTALPAIQRGGRYWVRTSDPRVVRANDGETNPDQLELFRRSD
jgi:hypothetical protein